MKRTIGLVAAVVLLGTFVVACGQKPAEPASTPATSPAPAATEEPAVSPEPSPSAQPVDQETTEQAPANEGADYESDTELEAKITAQGEQWIQDMMNKWGISREEAEQAYFESAERGQQAAAEEQQRIQDRQEAYEEFAEQDAQRAKEESDSYYMERYGITQDEALGMSPDELIALFNQKHGG